MKYVYIATATDVVVQVKQISKVIAMRVQKNGK